MNTERTPGVERRVRIHAALADPARLRIVDALTVGDESPSRLAAMLAMPSNLVAHHLRVLEAEAIVTRSRSEADRRRTYVRLVPGALDGLAPGSVGTAARVVFVCTANSARSQLAAALWRRASDIPAASAGTHPAARIDPGALAVAARHDLPLPRRRPQSLADVTEPDDVVITVCDTAHEELGDLGAMHWSVPDPVRAGTDTAFDAAYLDLTGRVDNLAPRLTSR